MNEHTSTGLTRREALASAAAFGTALAAGSIARAASPHGLTPEQLGWDAAKGEYALPPLPYAFDALEPHIDAMTVEIHHGRHHAANVRGLNAALAKLAEVRAGTGDAALVKHWSRELAFHGSGHINHALYWLTMAPAGSGGGGEPTGALAEALARDFGSFAAFSAHFQAAAAQVDGAGWAWLVFEPVAGRLLVMQAEKQQDMASMGVRPLLGVDVWEHAYYLKHQNRRADHLKDYMQVVHWARVADLFAAASA